MHHGNQWPLPPRAFIIFSAETISCKCPRWDQQICYNNAHIWAWKCEQMSLPPSRRQSKNLACERGCKTSNPRSEYNERTSINCHKYNPGNNIWALNENKLYFIHKILVAWVLSFRNNVTTMLQRCAVLQTVKMDVFFQIGSSFYTNLPCNLWNSDTFYSNSLQSFPNWAPPTAVYSPR